MGVTVPTFLVARNFIANDVDVMVLMLRSGSPLTVMEWICNGVDVGVKVTIDSDGEDM